MIKIRKKLLYGFIFILLIALLVPTCVFADEDKDELNVNIELESEQATVNVGIDSDQTDLHVDIDGNRPDVYINNEALDNLRPQYHIKKTTYDDDWIYDELNRINYNIEVLANGLDNIYAKEANEINELYNLLIKLRSELYQEMNRLHYGQTVVKTIIGSNSFTVNENLHKFNTNTTFRKDDFTTLMSIRLLENLGVEFYFERVDGVGIVTMVYGDKNVVLRENSNIMVVVDSKEIKKVELTTPMTIIGPRSYIPTRDVSEYLGFEVLWDEVVDSIIISLPAAEKPEIMIDEAIYTEQTNEDTESEQDTGYDEENTDNQEGDQESEISDDSSNASGN